LVAEHCRQNRQFVEAAVSPQVGARLVHFVESWKTITKDKWALNIIQEGLRLQFKSLPADSGTRTTVIVDVMKQRFISEEVQSL
jgi:hypothetical protein